MHTTGKGKTGGKEKKKGKRRRHGGMKEEVWGGEGRGDMNKEEEMEEEGWRRNEGGE